MLLDDLPELPEDLKARLSPRDLESVEFLIDKYVRILNLIIEKHVFLEGIIFIGRDLDTEADRSFWSQLERRNHDA